ncbi:hypothetical protein B9P99_04165 [Candidatus Marsarchaeota G1 archaeon OSP_B]|uniref:Uncharacterized protein n=1 Tax=Candidatus Marsarchaeota G1 archaeon OSP_B TaxID=1978153 RepID=A0A2R6AY97_9ARCH|nr:MAG: hypothetical protein B9P99_04165 [Candidatus Marsarchaeota G1 archaeon OSP_B]
MFTRCFELGFQLAVVFEEYALNLYALTRIVKHFLGSYLFFWNPRSSKAGFWKLYKEGCYQDYGNSLGKIKFLANLKRVSGCEWL